MGNQACFEETQRAQFESLRDTIIPAQELDSSEAAAMLELLNQGDWTQAQKQALAHVVAARATRVETSSVKVLRSNATQLFLHMENYPTPELVEYLRGDSDTRQKMKAFGAFFLSLGLAKPSEKTMKHAMALFSVLTNTCLRDQELVSVSCMVRELKKHMKSRSLMLQEPPLLEYPAEPSRFRELRPKTFDGAYSNGTTLPMEKPPAAIQDLQEAEQFVALRSTRGKRAFDQSSERVMAGTGPQMELMRGFTQMMQVFMNNVQSGASDSVRLQMCPPTARTLQLPSAPITGAAATNAIQQSSAPITVPAGRGCSIKARSSGHCV